MKAKHIVVICARSYNRQGIKSYIELRRRDKECGIIWDNLTHRLISDVVAFRVIDEKRWLLAMIKYGFMVKNDVYQTGKCIEN